MLKASSLKAFGLAATLSAPEGVGTLYSQASETMTDFPLARASDAIVRAFWMKRGVTE
jgi:hypothetical protein